MASASGVRITVAPKPRMRMHFSSAKPFGHKEHHLVAAMHANQGQPYPGIAGGRLDDGRTRLQQTTALRVQDHAQRRPVLDAAAGVEELKFGVDVGRPGGHHPVKVEHGGGPHQLCYIFSNMQRARCNFTSKKGHRPTDKCSSDLPAQPGRTSIGRRWDPFGERLAALAFLTVGIVAGAWCARSACCSLWPWPPREPCGSRPGWCGLVE